MDLILSPHFDLAGVLEDRNPDFLNDAHDNTPTHNESLSKVKWFRIYTPDKHYLMISTLTVTVTLTLRTAKEIVTEHSDSVKLDCKRFRIPSGDMQETVLGLEPAL